MAIVARLLGSIILFISLATLVRLERSNALLPKLNLLISCGCTVRLSAVTGEEAPP